MTVSSLARWVHTISYLKPKQVYGRLWFKLYRPKIDFSPAPPLRPPHSSLFLTIKRPSCLIRPGLFKFLNEEQEISDAAGWDSPSQSKLWRYHLHYFDELSAEGAVSRKD